MERLWIDPLGAQIHQQRRICIGIMEHQAGHLHPVEGWLLPT